MLEETGMTKPNRGFAAEREEERRGKENELILLASVFATQRQ